MPAIVNLPRLRHLLLCLALSTGGLLGAAESTAPGPAQDFDLQGFIDAALKAGAKQVVVPPGRYRVTPAHGRHLVFKDLADVEIIADGVEMVCTQTVQALRLEHCRNLRFKGLTVDYDPLPFTEARITALAPDKSWAEFEIIDGYPDNSLEERIEIYDPATRELRRETAGWEKEIQPLGSHRYRASKHPGYHFQESTDTEQVGDILVTNNAFPAKAGGHAIELQQCTAVTMEEVTVLASPCFGFMEHQCDGTSYLHCKIDRRAQEADPVKRGFARMRSLNADAFHSNEAAKGPAIIGCTAKFQGHDCVNIHGVYHLVTASQGRTLRIASLSHLTIEPGDPVEFLPYAGERPADATALTIEPDPQGITEEEKAFVQKVSLNENNRRLLLDGKATFYKVTLDHEVPLAMGSAVCSGKRVGNGFVVKDCDFGYNRSRGILIKASHGEVSGNRITNGWMAAVLIAPEFWWFEAASSSDVVIKNNTITGCKRPAIEIIAPGGNGKPLPAGAHRQLEISGNTMAHSVWPNIHVTSTDGLTLQGNTLTPLDQANPQPPAPNPRNWHDEPPSTMVMQECLHVTGGPKPVISVPVRVHLMQSATQPAMQTTLTEADVKRILGKVNTIWAQAGIRFDMEPLRQTQAQEPPQADRLKDGFQRVTAAIPEDSRSATAINVFYVKDLEPNGFYRAGDVYIKDTAKLRPVDGGLDEPIPRVTSHELGHALGLQHRQNTTNLMASGTTGFSLNEAEIQTARTSALLRGLQTAPESSANSR